MGAWIQYDKNTGLPIAVVKGPKKPEFTNNGIIQMEVSSVPDGLYRIDTTTQKAVPRKSRTYVEKGGTKIEIVNDIIPTGFTEDDIKTETLDDSAKSPMVIKSA